MHYAFVDFQIAADAEAFVSSTVPVIFRNSSLTRRFKSSRKGPGGTGGVYYPNLEAGSSRNHSTENEIGTHIV